ncbi:MAG: PAS domain S-box protein [Acidobacteria bacterium]|nr:PAS domain S-box protein [Acidobacteriota bacterium]
MPRPRRSSSRSARDPEAPAAAASAGSGRLRLRGRPAPGTPKMPATLAMATLDAMTSQVATLDRTGRIVMTNEPWRRFAVENGGDQRVLGEGVSYLAVCDAVRGPEPDAIEARTVAQAIRDVLAGRLRVFVHEYACHAPSIRRWFQVRVTPIGHASPGRVVVTHTEITHRRMADEARTAAQRRFEALFQFAPDGLVIATSEGTITQVNHQAERLFGYTAAELVGAPVEVLVPGDTRSGHREHRRAYSALAHPRLMGSDAQRLRAVRKDGTEFFAEVALGPIEVDEGLAVIAAVRDVTARCELEDQLRQSQKLEVVGRLSGGVAHDFNNLVQVIGTSAEFALSHLPHGAPLRRDIEVIREAGTRAAALTRQLLAFSGRQVSQPEMLDLRAHALSLEPILQRLLGPTITVAITSHEPLWRVYADPTQVEQVLLNLAANARDAMPAGGSLSIELSNVTAGTTRADRGETASHGELVQIVVRDTGLGMDPATRARVFEPFFTTKAPGKGSGLGLSTVYGIVRQCDGDIQCDSQPGEGTTFTIRLPGVDAAGTAQAGTAGTTGDEEERGSGTILVIDDEEFLRVAIGRILERKGYRVLSAGSGEEALRLVETHEGALDLVVSDVLMPGMGGWEVAARIRERRPVPVLFTSGYADDNGFEHRLGQLDARFIAKPFTGVSLLRTVREVLATPDQALA